MVIKIFLVYYYFMNSRYLPFKNFKLVIKTSVYTVNKGIYCCQHTSYGLKQKSSNTAGI